MLVQIDSSKFQSSGIEHLTDAILSILAKHSHPLDATQPAFGPHSQHRIRVENAILEQRTLEIILPAFPAKSANRGKTLSAAPDMGEVLALSRLQNICREIARIHNPGVKLLICSDGRVFSDLVGVSETDVTDYAKAIENIISDFHFSHLSTFHLEQAIQAGTGDAMRTQLMNEYSSTLEELRANTLRSAAAKELFNGIHRFLFEDQISQQEGKSRNQVREETKALAYQVILRSNAWSSLLAKEFPHAVRLSIHPQFAQSTKLGFQLVEAKSRWATPWHNVALLRAEGFSLVKRSEAEAIGAELRHFQGKYAYFAEGAL